MAANDKNKVKPIWKNSSTPYGKISETGDQEYVNSEAVSRGQKMHF